MMYILMFSMTLNGAPFGTVRNAYPMDEKTCVTMLLDSQVIDEVKGYVKSTTGHDVEVTGTCIPVE